MGESGLNPTTGCNIATIRCGVGIQHWTASHFANGDVLLTCNSAGGSQFRAHFDADGWREFTAFVAGEGA